MTKHVSLIAVLGLAASGISGCSSVSNMITEYQCAGGNHFYVKFMDNGPADKNGTAWLIYPDREVALTKATGSTTRYTNGVAILDINNNEATLNDGPTIAYTACKVPAPIKK